MHYKNISAVKVFEIYFCLKYIYGKQKNNGLVWYSNFIDFVCGFIIINAICSAFFQSISYIKYKIFTK